MLRLVALLTVGFQIWMFSDAVRRRAETYWFWAILTPIGAVVYFAVVKLRDPGVKILGRKMLEGFQKPPSVEQLQRAFDRTPSLANRIALGQGMFDAERYAQARAHFEGVLELEPKNKDGLYGLGLCRLELDDAKGAVAALTELLEIQKSYRDYAAFPELAEAHFRLGDKEAAVELTAELVRTSPRLPHQLLHARFLERVGRNDEAAKLLSTALEENEQAPRHVRRQNRRYARKARRRLERLTAA